MRSDLLLVCHELTVMKLWMKAQWDIQSFVSVCLAQKQSKGGLVRRVCQKIYINGSEYYGGLAGRRAIGQEFSFIGRLISISVVVVLIFSCFILRKRSEPLNQHSVLKNAPR